MKLGWGYRHQTEKRGIRPTVAVWGVGWGWGRSAGQEENGLEVESREMVSRPIALPPVSI